MIETEPALRGRRRVVQPGVEKSLPVETTSNPEDIEYRREHYFSSGLRDEFVEVDEESDLERLLADGVDAHVINDYLRSMRPESRELETMLRLESAYFALVKQGHDDAGLGIQVSRFVEDLLRHSSDREKAISEIWREVCKTRAVRKAMSLVRKGDPRVNGLTYPLDSTAKSQAYDDLVGRLAVQIDRAAGGFEAFKISCLGVIAEYATGSALRQAADKLPDEIHVYYPLGKDYAADSNPHEEEGKGIDWVVTCGGADTGQALLVQVKSQPFIDQGQTFFVVRSQKDLSDVMMSLAARQLAVSDPKRRAQKFLEIEKEIRESMTELLAHAKHGETPILCVLPSVAVNLEGGRTDAFYDEQSGQPTDSMVTLARRLLKQFSE